MMPLMPLFLVTDAKSSVRRITSSSDRSLFKSVQRRSERGVKCGPFEIRQETDRTQRLFKLKL